MRCQCPALITPTGSEASGSHISQAIWHHLALGPGLHWAEPNVLSRDLATGTVASIDGTEVSKPILGGVNLEIVVVRDGDHRRVVPQVLPASPSTFKPVHVYRGFPVTNNTAMVTSSDASSWQSCHFFKFVRHNGDSFGSWSAL